MSEHRLPPKVRVLHRINYMMRLRAVDQAPTARRFTPMPAKMRLSTRGQTKPSYYTKRWTPSRLKDLKEAREAA